MGHTSDERFTHHVIGAVHEVVVSDQSADALARAIEHELIECEAVRFVIDLSAFEELTEAHLDLLRPLAEQADRAAVRVSEGTAAMFTTVLSGMGISDVITEQCPGQRCRAGLPYSGSG